MNRGTMGLSVSKAIVGFLQYKAAEGLSPNTLTSYEHHLSLLAEHLQDPDVSQVTSQHVTVFLAWLQTDYEPHRFSGSKRPLARKTVRNFWATLCSFFTWASCEFDLPSPMKRVPAPRFERAPVEPFSKADVEALLKACRYSREAATRDRRRYRMRRPTSRRDQAIILVLLDTGLRASELCALTVCDVDSRTGRVQVRHGRSGGAKYGKGRTVFLGKVARRVLWRYLAEREDGEEPDAPLFLGNSGRPVSKNALRLLIRRLGEKAGLEGCHPHRFRHTFAITYLRSGGDIFTLQALLGHSSLEMVRYYARIAEIDIEQAHRRASPADNWRL